MDQEDETLKCKRIGSDYSRRPIGRPCKMPYPKLVPQRGLGMAQLEQLRLQQEQKDKTAVILLHQLCLVSPILSCPSRIGCSKHNNTNNILSHQR